MKTEIWDYKGYLNHETESYGVQNYWNATILAKINSVAGNIEKEKNVFVPENLKDIFESIIAYREDGDIFGKYFIKFLKVKSNTVYVTDSDVEEFEDLNLDAKNYGKVIIQNYE